MIVAPRKPPAAVVRGKELADRLRGRDLLFKARNYMGPVHVDVATCSTRWFILKMTTRPWQADARPRVLDWVVSPGAVAETAVRVTVRAYDTVGVLVHDPKGIEEIQALFRSGASVQQLLSAFNHRKWPPHGDEEDPVVLRP